MINGIWVLTLVIHTGLNQIVSMPLFVYPDAQFGYYECLQDKKKYTKTFLKKYFLTCERYGEA